MYECLHGEEIVYRRYDDSGWHCECPDCKDAAVVPHYCFSLDLLPWRGLKEPENPNKNYRHRQLQRRGVQRRFG